MSLSPISSNPPPQREPEPTKARKRTEGSASAAPRETQAASARGLVADIGTRLEQLRARDQVRRSDVDAVLEEVRLEALLTRENLEKAADTLLNGDDPLRMPPP